MTKITQTGYVKPHERATFIEVTGPWSSGNDREPEVHLAMVDEDSAQFIEAWFPVDMLLYAITRASTTSD